MRFALPVLTCLVMLAGADAATAANSNDLQYWGGPVAHSMKVELVEWGSSVRSSYTNASTGDPAFFRYLASQSGATSDIGGVLAQYMDTTASNSPNQFSYDTDTQITPPTSGGPGSCKLPSCVDDSVIQSMLQSDIKSKNLPSPAGDGLSTIYVVLFPPNVNVCSQGTCAYDAGGFCAYHGSLQLPSSTQVLYAAMVDNGPSTPDYQLCGTNPGNTTADDVANQTDVMSHEFAETINDPLVAEVTVNGPPLAWYNTSQGEIGDICVGGNEETSNGPWTVQRIWSNLDSSCLAAESAYAAPTASFLAPSTAVSAVPVTFDASSSSDPTQDTASASYSGTTYSISSGITSYQWNWGDGSSNTTSSTPTATHSYAAAGSYHESLTVTDKLGFTSTVTQSIVVGSGGSPAVRTDGTTGITDQGATVNGTINPEGQTGQYRFVYGTAPAVSDLTQSTPQQSLPVGPNSTAVSAVLSALAPSTIYFYALEAITGNGATTTVGSVNSFTTSAAPPNPPPPQPPAQTPVAATGGASQIATTGSVLSGTVNPGGSQPVTYDFAYGSAPSNLTQSTPQATEPDGSTAAPVSAQIGGLTPGTTYYYRLDVGFGAQTYSGAVMSFTTLIPLPTASTGGASRVTSTGATVAGTVNPNGAPTTYVVEFGTSTAYGHSSISSSAGSGRSVVPVSATLTGLRGSTTYHYRVVAMSAGGTAVGTDSTFTTRRALAPAPRFSFRIVSGVAAASAISRGLKARFTCSKACVAHFTVTVAPAAGIRRFAPVLVTVARGQARLRSAGSRTAAVSFLSKVRSRLRSQKSLKLAVSGYATSTGSNASLPKTTRIELS